MATVNPTINDLSGDGQVIKFVWELTTANADGAPIGARYAAHADRTVYATGTWGGATMTWQGGDGATWLTLTDSLNTSFALTANGIDAVNEVPEFSRPNLTVAGAGATVTVTCIARRTFKRGA